MKITDVIAMLRAQNPLSLIGLMRDWRAFTRLHFLYAAMESGLLGALKTPSLKQDLLHDLDVKRPEFLDALLDVGLACGELSCKRGLYRAKGRRARCLMDDRGDALAALVQANVTYYNSVYRHFADRLGGAPLGHYLEDIGGVVARFAKLTEPVVRGFIKDVVAGGNAIRILEVGCGSGIYLRTAFEAAPGVSGIGIDMDPEVVEQARQNLDAWGIGDRFDVMVGDIRFPPAGLKGAFDLITLYNIVYYFEPEEQRELFPALRGMLSPGGSIVLVTSAQSQGKDLAAANLNMATISMVGCTPLPDLDEITSLLEECGLDVVKRTRLMPGSEFYGIVATAK